MSSGPVVQSSTKAYYDRCGEDDGRVKIPKSTEYRPSFSASVGTSTREWGLLVQQASPLD